MKSLAECKAGGAQIWTATVAGHELHFRRPTTREWAEFEAVQLSVEARKDGASFAELQLAAERLIVRVVESHTPEELQDLNDALLGIWIPVIGQVVDAVMSIRAAAGKAQSEPGPA